MMLVPTLEKMVGEIVVFGGYLKPDAGVEVEGVKFLICQAGDIIAKVKK